MDRNQQETAAAQLDRTDAILASEEAIVPSSGFLAAVMERVQEEVRTPEPIPFPWKRAVPGFVVIGGVLCWGGVELVRIGVPALKGNLITAPHLSVAMTVPLQQAGWVALAAGISLASWLLARKLVGRRDSL